jgi:hypothetical protein
MDMICIECWSCKETVEHGGSLALGRLYHKVNNKINIIATYITEIDTLE